jgi:hypothetical protein
MHPPKAPSPLLGLAQRACPRSRGPASASPSSTRSGTSGQEDPAHDHDPHQADDGRDEPRIGAVRCPESTALPRGAAQQDEHDGCDPRREECVRDQPGPPEPERPGHDQHRPRERSQHDAGPRQVVQSRCERVISVAGDRVRQRCAHSDELEEKPSEHRAGGGRCRAPAVLSRICQGDPDRRREPQEVEDRQSEEHGCDQYARAIALVERGECVGRPADVRLRTVDDVRDDEAADRLDAGRPSVTNVPRTHGWCSRW